MLVKMRKRAEAVLPERHAGLSRAELLEMRYWLADNCADMEQAEFVAEMSEAEVARVVEREYAGGIPQFLADGEAR